MSLISQMRKARQSIVAVDDYKFTIRRPTDSEAAQLFRDGNHQNPEYIASEFVVGWEGVTEARLVQSGTSDVVEFDLSLWREWCADSPQFWVPIYAAVMEAFSSHVDKREEAAKN